jgi:hypothetical protein
MHYLKYVVPNKLIFDKIIEKQYKNVIFYIDMMSISRGYFNKQVATLEICSYSENRQLPTLFINELKQFLGQLHSYYAKYSPKFVIFYDSGHENQNRNFSSTYKSDSGGGLNAILEDDELQLFRQIKQYYFEQVNEKFNIKNISKVLYLKNIETDYIPYFVLDNNLIDSNNSLTANIILSVDKDLLQTCEFDNVYQAISVYLKSESRISSALYDKDNAIEYIFKKFKRGFLTAKYIPLVLALAGDKADQIPNLFKGLGFAKAIDLILQYNLPPIFNDTYELPEILKPYRKQLIRNLSLTSFELQIKRIPFHIHSDVKNLLTDF